MIKEPEFYKGASRCYKISEGDNKTVNLRLCKPLNYMKVFSGSVICGSSKKPIKYVYVEINYGTFQQSEYTDEKGCFSFMLPCYVDTVKIRFYKRGFMNLCINAYDLKQDCGNCLCLHMNNLIKEEKYDS